MVEVVLGMWVTCFILSMGLIGWNYMATKNQINSKKLKTLNLNLEKINRYWSISNDNFEVREDQSIQKDAERALRSNLFLGLLGLGSLIGFILLLAIVLSLRFWIKNKKAVDVFHSPLAENPNLNSSEVQVLYQQFAGNQ